jgi:two-component system cell cycle response regulator
MPARTHRTPFRRLTERARRGRVETHSIARDSETGLPGRLQLRADLEASGGARTLQVVGLHAADGCEPEWVEAEPQLPRRIATSLDRLVEPLGMQTYRLDGLLFAILGPEEGAERVDLTFVGQAVAGVVGERASSVVHGAARLPDDGFGAEALAVALRRLRARARRQGRSAERQVRDVLLGLLAERRAGGSPVSLPNVAAHAVAVGRKLGLSLEELDEVVRAAELQDVGKLALPESILTKRGSLTEDEWRVVRTHPQIAERIIGAAPALAPVARLVRASAERWDGSGYPDGLRGQVIPLGSRIIAVCVAFDAITEARPYRQPLTPAEALEELRSWAGRQFDPLVVTAFCTVMAEVGAEADKTVVSPV